MKISDKKMAIASRMYKQNGTGGQGALAEKYKQNSKGEGKLNMKYIQNGKSSGYAGGMKTNLSNAKGKFDAKYSQANDGQMKGGYKQANY